MDEADQADQVSTLAQEIYELARGVKGSGNLEPGEARVKLQEASRKLTVALESPPEVIFRHAFEVIIRSSCLLSILVAYMDSYRIDFPMALYEARHHLAALSSCCRG